MSDSDSAEDRDAAAWDASIAAGTRLMAPPVKPTPVPIDTQIAILRELIAMLQRHSQEQAAAITRLRQDIAAIGKQIERDGWSGGA